MRWQSLFRFVCAATFAVLLVPTVLSMPPSPELLERIQRGEIPASDFFEEPVYVPGDGSPILRMLAGRTDTVEFRILPILIDWQDRPHVVDASHFDTLIFGDQFGSFKDYFREVTYGKVILTTLHLPSQLGWIRLSGNYNRIIPYDEIMQAIDSVVDFSQYVTPGEGKVTGIWTIHSGRGREASGDPNDIWSNNGYPPSFMYDGVRIGSCPQTPEYEWFPRDHSFGVYCHEFAHSFFDLFDLYGQPQLPGDPSGYSLMSYGSWNGSPGGSCPAHIEAWSKVRMGAAVPTVVMSDALQVPLPAIAHTSGIFRLWMNGISGPEYFLIENRQQMGYDAHILAPGLLIWHCDDHGDTSYTHGPARIVTGEMPHGYYPFAWPSSPPVRTFDDSSTPNSKSTNGNTSFVGIRNISDSDSVMYADLAVSNPNPPSITVLHPHTGEMVQEYFPYTLTWSSSGVFENVRLALRRDGGPWTPLGGSLPNDGDFVWNVTGPATNAAQLRIRSVLDSNVFAISEDFSIYPPRVTVIDPPAGDTWLVGDLQTITWDSEMNPLASIALGIIRNGVWQTITSSAPNTGSFLWEVSEPDAESANIVISFTDYPDVIDTSETFRVGLKPLNLVGPNGGEYFALGDTCQILWQLNHYPDEEISIYLSRDYGSPHSTWEATAEDPTWEIIADRIPARDGSYTWITEGELTTRARLRIVDPRQEEISDTSNADFTICGSHSLTLNAPNGGEIWYVNVEQAIEWTSENLGANGHIRIELCRNFTGQPGDSWETLAGSASNTGTYTWMATGPESSHCRVRVRSVEHPSISSISQDDFAVFAPSITITSPHQGDLWFIDDTDTIEWTSTHIDPGFELRLEYYGSPDSLFPPEWIRIENTSNSGMYFWTVPNAYCVPTFIRILCDQCDPPVGDTSEAFSTGTRRLQLTCPNGGDTWGIFSEQFIRWESNDPDQLVRIEINRDYPQGAWELVAESVPDQRELVWLVTGPATSTARMRIYDVAHPDIISESEGNFTILQKLTVVTPNGGEHWNVGDIHDIIWTDFDLSPDARVSIEVYRGREDERSWETLCDTISAHADTFRWRVTGWYSSVVTIRVLSLENPQIGDTSDSYFGLDILPPTVIAPNGGEVWPIREQRTILWDPYRLPLSCLARIELNRAYPAGVWERISDATADDGEFVWEASRPLTTNARIRVISNTGTDDGDTSDAAFRIVDRVPYVIVPICGERWIIGEEQAIQWESDYADNGGIGSASERPGEVMIEIHRNCGSGDTPWEMIVERTLNTGEYPWKVDGDPTDCARIRVSLADYPTVCDTSDGEFIILKCDAESAELGFQRQASDPTRILEIPRSDTPFIFRGTEFVAWADMPSAVTVSLWPINRSGVLADAPFYERVCTPELRPSSSSDRVSWAHVAFENEGGEFPVLGSSDVLLRITRLDDDASPLPGRVAGSALSAQSTSTAWQPLMARPSDFPGEAVSPMVRVDGYNLVAPQVVLSCDQAKIVLNWNGTGSPSYHIYRAEAVDSRTYTLIGKVFETHFVDETSTVSGNRGFYLVRSATK